jgi:hypothetical protein
MVRRQHAQGEAVLVHGVDEALGQGGERLAVLGGALDDLVVDVGDVADVGDCRPDARSQRVIMSNTTSTRAWPRWQ